MTEARESLLDEVLVDRFNVVRAVRESSGMEMAVRVSDQHGYSFVWSGETYMDVFPPGGADKETAKVVSPGEEATLIRFLAAAQAFRRAR